MREFFDEMMDLGVEGMMLSPGYSYSKAPDQEHFLLQSRTHELFSKMLAKPEEALAVQPVAALPALPHGQARLRVHARGATRPTTCSAGSAPATSCRRATRATFQELMDTTPWENYGKKSGNEKCRDCMVHCGYEATAVDHTFSSLKGFVETVGVTLTGKL